MSHCAKNRLLIQVWKNSLLSFACYHYVCLSSKRLFRISLKGFERWLLPSCFIMIISSSTLMTLGRLLSLTGLQYPKDKCDPNPSFGFVMMTQSSTYFRKHKPLAMTMLRRTSVTWRLTLMRTTRSLKSPLPEVHLSSWPVLLKESDVAVGWILQHSSRGDVARPRCVMQSVYTGSKLKINDATVFSSKSSFFRCNWENFGTLSHSRTQRIRFASWSTPSGSVAMTFQMKDNTAKIVSGHARAMLTTRRREVHNILEDCLRMHCKRRSLPDHNQNLPIQKRNWCSQTSSRIDSTENEKKHWRHVSISQWRKILSG